MISQDFGDRDWTRSGARFDREKYLRKYNEKHGDSLGRITVQIKKGDEKYDESLNECCWNALFNVKDACKQKKDWANYGFTYVKMANFLSKHGAFPKIYQDEFSQKEFHLQVRSVIPYARDVLTRQESLKLVKWSHIAEGLLYLDYIKQFPNTSRKDRYLAMAYQEFTEAMRRKTTKTVYLLIAEVILDYGYIPDYKTREEAIKFAYELIEKFRETTEKSDDSPPSYQYKPQKKGETSLSESFARPLYKRELKDCPKSPQYKPDVEIIEMRVPEDDRIVEVEEDEIAIDEDGFVEQPKRNELDPPTMQDHLIEDRLINFDYSGLIIPQRINAEGLPINQKVCNPLGRIGESYEIEGKRYRLQNVWGDGMRCFFNASGLNAQDQIQFLNRSANHPVVRWMIANELVCSSANPDQIPRQVKEAIRFSEYQTQRERLDVLETERSKSLLSQNRDRNLQNPDLLPENLQNLREKGEEILEDLRKKALSLEAYQAFIKYHIGGQQMMVMWSDLRDNGNANYTSIDAIGYVNNIGIKIYRKGRGETLGLVHQYIPSDAKKVAYLYHEGVHFQALIPEEEIEEDLDTMELEINPHRIDTVLEEVEETFINVDMPSKVSLQELTDTDQKFFEALMEELEMMGASLDDPDDVDSISYSPEVRDLIDLYYGEETDVYLWTSDTNLLKFTSYNEFPVELHLVRKNKRWYRAEKAYSGDLPSIEKLKKLYPKIEYNRGIHEPDLIRQVLFASEKLQLQQFQIAKRAGIEDSRRVGEILLANGIRTMNYLAPEVREGVIQAYLESYKDLQTKKIQVQNFVKAIAERFNVDKKLIMDQYNHILIPTNVERYQEVSTSDADEIVRMYREGMSLREIHEETELNFKIICNIISEKVDPKEFRNCLNLQIEKNKLSEKEKEEMIIKIFNDFKQKEGKSPPILKVANAVKNEGIGYKTVQRILKSQKLVAESIKAKHLNKETKNQIKQEFYKIDPGFGETKKTYQKLADKYKVTYVQVVDLLKERTYNSGKKVKLDNDIELVKELYNKLTDEEKKNPVKYIMIETGWVENSVRGHLKKLGLI